MRPLYHAKADRLRAKADRAREGGRRRSSRRSRRGARRSTTCSARPSPTCSWASAARTTRTPRRASPRTARSPTRRSSDAITAVMRQEAFNHKDLQPIDGRLGQRHVGDGDGRAHRLQHGLRLDAAQQSASLSVDELALPGRHHGRLALRRELHRRSRPPLGDPRAAGRRAPAPRPGRDQRRASTTSTCTSATP